VLADADSSSDVVAVTYFHGDCDSLRSVRTVSSSTTVIFRLKVHEPNGACNATLVGTSIRIPSRHGDAPALAFLDMSKLPIYGP